jgi:hypothetical protein
MTAVDPKAAPGVETIHGKCLRDFGAQHRIIRRSAPIIRHSQDEEQCWWISNAALRTRALLSLGEPWVLVHISAYSTVARVLSRS